MSRDKIDIVPLRVYDKDLIDFYKVAASTDDPYVEFISYYHIMEYHYDRIFRINLVDDLREKITDPSFSYRNDEDVLSIVSFVKQRVKGDLESGQGNELQSLKYVLETYVNIDDLKHRINQIDSSALGYYESYEVTYCKAKKVCWSDKQSVIAQVASRIYCVRNSLIHSKNEKDKAYYNPFYNEDELKKEIPLVRAIADRIIIETSVIR